MAKIPNPLERRHLIERDLSAAQALGIAEAYLAEGRAIEAVDFLEKAEAADRLSELRSEAIESGDAFLLRAVASAADQPPQRDEWRRLADSAARQGRDRYAEEATRQAERGED